MNKKVYLFAAVAALFAACSNNDGAESAEKAQAQAQAQQVPLAFDTYVSRSVTRSGKTGEFTGTNIKTDFKDEAFGVFAYYTNSETYDQVFTPNFMYNQLVKWDGSAFTYEPIKYWPNEYGSNALSDDVDKVSFFAYAPYVAATNVASGKVVDTTKGITGFTRNNVVGDPMVKYITTFGTDEQVDLCWGVVAATPPTWTNKNTDATSLTAGFPWLNIEHPTATSTAWASAQKVTFDFNHALAALNVQVDTKTNSTSPANPDATGNHTKVYIRSVTFEGFATKGALNLNNTTANTALWYNYDTNNELDNGDETVIQDGRKDGKEGITAATREYARINPNFVQSTLWDATSPMPGVTETPENLFSKADGTAAAGADDYIYVIPNGDKLKVTIEYDVLTEDDKLSGYLNDGKNHGSVVKNTITRYITASGSGDVANGDVTLVNGKKYLINLHLGLNSVEFDATVTAWGDAATPDGGADLPQNN